MAVMELTLSQGLGTVETINRFNYIASGTPASVTLSYALTRAFGYSNSTTLLPNTPLGILQSLQSATIVFKNVVAKDVFSVTDFYETPFTSNTKGSLMQESLPPFAGVGMRTNRVRSDIRRGTKRFVGLTETYGQNGTILPDVLVSWQTLANALSAPLTYDDEGNTITFTPCVTKKERYVTPDGTNAYRYFATEAEQMQNVAQGILWEVYSTVRSQVSRQW